MAEEKKKSTKLKDKQKPLKLLFKGVLFLLLIGISFNIFSVYSRYHNIAKKIFDDGRKIIIDVKSGKIDFSEMENKEDITLVKPEPLETVDTSTPENPDDKKTPEEVKKAEEDKKIADADKKTEAPKELSAPEVLDYKTANLAIIVTDLGLKQSNLDLAKTFVKEVTFAFSPYSRELQNKIRQAKGDGREILLNLAFESANYPLTDSGQFTLHTFFEANQNIFRLQSTVANADNFIGVLAPLDEVLTDKREVMSPILENLKKKNLFFSYLKTAKNVQLENDVKPMAVSILPIDYALTETMTDTEIKSTLSEIKVDLLKRKKRLVIAVRPYPNLISNLQEWLKANVGANIQVAPVSYFVIKN
jgi:polysaccharide deacetylase 2 family uncharacterized protein YibQ